MPWILIVLAVLLSGGLAVKKLTGIQAVRAALREAAVMSGIDPDILDAIGKVESNWNLSATNLIGPDGERGGAFGPTQITAKTATAHGYKGDPWAFTRDEKLAAEWTARIMRARPGGAPETIEDASAWWNAGRASASYLPAGHVTRVQYIPRAVAALEAIQEEGIA